MDRPIVSFTFDDAPRTAFDAGAAIMARHGARGTYYISLGLAGLVTEVGRIASHADFKRAVDAGHELGCHTFDHHDAWHVTCAEYMSSIAKNSAALEAILPGYAFDSFAYPKSGATAGVKAQMTDRFVGCRGGGQTTNVGTVDLNHIQACFLDRRTGIEMGFVEALLAKTVAQRGWLVLATHDIAAEPSPFGCTPDFLDEIALRARQVGADLVPVREAIRLVAGKG